MKFNKNNFNFFFLNYISDLIIIWLPWIFYRYNNYYVNFLADTTQTILLYIAVAYSVISLPYQIYNTLNETNSKGRIFIKTFISFINQVFGYINSFTVNVNKSKIVLKPEDRTILLIYLVKIYYIPLMLNYLIQDVQGMMFNYNYFIANLHYYFSLAYFNQIIYPLLYKVLFVVDTFFFTFGYIIETKFLKSTIKSVEPTFFGWFVALICYQPFINIISPFVPWYTDFSIYYFNSITITFIFRFLIIILLIIYVWASISLGAKCSNLTNRGIVSKGAYKYVRHPAYISKNLLWWLMIIPVIPQYTIFPILSMAFWSFIYFLRAITEERHLMQDVDYQNYCKVVKYRFIPYVY